MEFTKEELYEIEKYFDTVAGRTGEQLRKSAEVVMLSGATKDIPKRTTKQIFRIMDDWCRANQIACSIKDKCEKLRLNR